MKLSKVMSINTGLSTDNGVKTCLFIMLMIPIVDADQRCLLEDGGSTDTILASENTEIGSNIGRIRVVGIQYILYFTTSNSDDCLNSIHSY